MIKLPKSSILVASQFWPAAFYWSHLRRYLKINIFTARKRGGEGNVFSRVCVSAERAGALDGGVCTGLWPYPPEATAPWACSKLVHVGPYYTGSLALCSNLYGTSMYRAQPQTVQSCSLCCVSEERTVGIRLKCHLVCKCKFDRKTKHLHVSFVMFDPNYMNVLAF